MSKGLDSNTQSLRSSQGTRQGVHLTVGDDAKHMGEDPLTPHARPQTEQEKRAIFNSKRVHSSVHRQDPNGMYHYDVGYLPASTPGRVGLDPEAIRKREKTHNILVAIALIVAVVAFLIGAYVFVGPSLFSLSWGSEGDSQTTSGDSSGAAASTASTATQVDVCMVGDVLLHPSVYTSGEQEDGTYDFTNLFANVSDQVSAADIAMCDQETVLGGTELGLSGYPAFNGPQEVGDAEAAAGFNVILHASNHTLDMGYEGLHSELEFWRTKHPDVTVLGCIDVLSDDPASLDDIYVYEKDGLKVAILNYTYGLGDYSDTEGAVAMLDEDRVRQDCERANQLADIVIVCPHWGTEGMSEPDDEQTQWAQVFLECGVDVVLGNHPHMLQPVEVLEDDNGNQMVCFWSVGNFISGMANEENMVGGLAEVRLERSEDGTCRVSGYGLKPIVSHIDPDNETTYFLSDYTDELAETSKFPDYTPDQIQAYCEEVLGDAYDSEKCELWVDL